MKTVQEYFRTLDEDRLISAYLYNNPVTMKEFEKSDASLTAINEKIKSTLHQYIERLRTLPIEKTDFEGVLYVHRIIKDEISSEAFSLINLKELREKGHEATDYGYEFSTQNEIVGFQVADTKLTQCHIYDLMADVMYEASFFGFEQEHLEEEKRKLEEAVKEIDEGKTVPWEEVKAELKAEFGEDLHEEETEEEVALREKVIRASWEYAQYSRRKELDALMAAIQ